MRLASALLMLLCCAGPAAAASVQDDYARTVTLPAPAKRIVSLAPHLTEVLFAAGAGDRVVGAVDYSDFPPDARNVPRVGSEAGIDIESLVALRPDLVVAWPNAGSARTIDRIEQLGIPVFRSEPRSLEDIPRTLERLGALAGTPQPARREADAFRSRARRLADQYSARPRMRVFYQVWDRPLVTVNGEHVISNVIALCGGENVFADLPLIAPEIDREAVLRADPDVIIASGSGDKPPAALDAWRSFPGLRAVARGHLYAVPADLLQRHSPRILEGAEALCRILEAARAR
jgi:iron complex transport system substrate-binding protein